MTDGEPCTTDSQTNTDSLPDNSMARAPVDHYMWPLSLLLVVFRFFRLPFYNIFAFLISSAFRTVLRPYSYGKPINSSSSNQVSLCVCPFIHAKFMTARDSNHRTESTDRLMQIYGLLDKSPRVGKIGNQSISIDIIDLVLISLNYVGRDYVNAETS